MSRSAAIDRYGEAFRGAMRKLLPADDIILPLSGGRDSRHILFEMIEAGRKPHAVTVPRWAPDIDHDLPIARHLADRFGLRHSVLGTTLAKGRAQRRASEEADFASDEFGWMLPMRRFLDDQSGVVFDGIAGDVMSDGLFLHRSLLAQFESGDTERVAEVLLGREDVWRAVLGERLYKSLARERAVAALQRELKKHLDAPNPVSSYVFWNRTRREISLFGFKFLGNVRMPYIDEDVYDHLAALPAAYFLDKTFHTETIHRLFPQYADIPFDPKSTDRAGRWRFRAESLGALAHLLWARSEWFRSARPLLDLRTRPSDIGRMLCLLQLENFLRRVPEAQRGAVQ
jgi:asparagine synthetase B (glutamine-hydrolysing)